MHISACQKKHMFQKSWSRFNGVHILAYLSGCHRRLFNMFSKILLPPQRGAHSEATQSIDSACFSGSSAALGVLWVYWAVWGRSWMKFLSARHRLACSQPARQPASQPASLPTSQPDSQPASPASQPAGQPASNDVSVHVTGVEIESIVFQD